MNTPISVLLENKGSDVHTLPPTATVFEAVRVMIEEKIGSVLIVDGRSLLGIFTERDVLVRVVGANQDPTTTPVSFVMTQDPTSVPSSTTVQEVMDLHVGKEFRHLPVVDDGQLVGLLSFRDILRWISQRSGAALAE